MDKTHDRVLRNVYFHKPSNRVIDISPVKFHGYTVLWSGQVLGKRGKVLATEKRARRGGGYDICVHLYYNGKRRKWTLSRLIGACFLGNIEGMEMNHENRDPTDNGGPNLKIVTRSENQRHWRDCASKI